MIFNQILGRKTAVRAVEPSRHWLRAILVILLLAIVLYYLIGAMVVHTIDDDPNLAPQPIATKQSLSVDLAARLIERETRDHHWTANDPFFLPGALLDNMPNYQQGIVAGISGFVTALRGITAQDNGRTDPRLDLAASMLSWPGTVWMFNPDVSWWPIAAAEEQYQKAAESLRLFNRTLAETNSLPRRGEDLLLLLDWLIQDLDLLARVSAEHLDDTADSWFELNGDDLFYFAKGRLYADGMLLHYIEQDFALVLRSKGLETSWQDLTAAVQKVGALNPWLVSQGSPDGLQPNHIITQAYLMLHARELADSLRQSLMDGQSAVTEPDETTPLPPEDSAISSSIPAPVSPEESIPDTTQP